MKRKPVVTLLALGLALTLVTGLSLAEGPAPQERTAPQALTMAGNTISYQGYLLDGGIPANGIYDFVFSLYADAAGTQWVGTADGIDNELVVDGIFTVEPDFTVSGLGDIHFYFDGMARWLSVGVRPGASTGAYTYLTPLQPLTPAPYAQALPGLHTIQNDTSPNVVGGYPWNSVGLGLEGATISGGGLETQPNTVNGNYGTVGGGRANTTSGLVATIGGGAYNEADADYATVGGGGGDSALAGNRVTDNHGTVGGGQGNQAGNAAGAPDDAHYATVGGGFENQAASVYTTVGGGEWNVASGIFSTIGGGQANTTVGGTATVGGGTNNTADGASATVAGGYINKANAGYASVGGGRHNEVTGAYGTIAGGGGLNLADGNQVTNDYAAVGGGAGNDADGTYATVPGGYHNTAGGDYSFAAGRQAKATYSGCFVWGDGSTSADIGCYGPNRTVFRSTGGFYIQTSNASPPSGLYLASGGSSWNTFSDRRGKQNFRAVDSEALLARVVQMPVSTWNYRAQDASIRHIGPMAQDFNALLKDLGGEGQNYINSLDADGVSLAAIQGLYLLLQEKEQALAQQQAQISDLEARLAALEGVAGTTKPMVAKVPAGWLVLGGLVAATGILGYRKARGGGR